MTPTPPKPTDTSTRVFVVDDHPLLCDAVRHALDGHPKLEFVGEAGTVAATLDRVAAARPDLLVVDVRLPDGSGVDVCRALRTDMPEVRSLILTAFSDDDALFESIEAGASGFVLKQIGARGLIDSLERVAAGESLIDSSVTGRILDRIRDPRSEVDERLASLTPMEREVLGHVANGLTNKQIAPLVSVSDTSVKNYVSSIFRKLGLSRRTEAAVYALKSGKFTTSVTRAAR
jgi:DNA-binding NarL/FixJ family response regulator